MAWDQMALCYDDIQVQQARVGIRCPACAPTLLVGSYQWTQTHQLLSSGLILMKCMVVLEFSWLIVYFLGNLKFRYNYCCLLEHCKKRKIKS